MSVDSAPRYGNYQRALLHAHAHAQRDGVRFQQTAILGRARSLVSTSEPRMLRRLSAQRAAGLVRAALPALAPRVALPARSLSTAIERAPRYPPPPPIDVNRSAALLLQMPTEIGPFALNNIRDNIGARRKTRRLGRGVGSGRGRKLGRGQKGMKSRAGNHGLLKSDGGQTKLTKRVRACTPTADQPQLP